MTRGVLAAAILSVVCLGAFLNVEVYLEYFSDGPPYFGRRENMDKWSDPRPVLGAVDAGLIILIVGMARAWKAAPNTFTPRSRRKAD
jgi:hypothetical protein